MRKTLSFIFLFIALITQATTVKVSSVYTEQMSNPLGLDTTTPRFSWQMQRDRKSTRLNSSHMPKSRMPSSA